MRKFVIALSGPPGSGASTIGKLLARRLELKYFSPGKYFKKLSKEKNETKAALSYLQTKVGRSKELHEHIDNLQIKKAKKGDIVLEGTLSIHFLKNLADYKIWIDASIEKRAERTSKRDKIPMKEAIKKIKKREYIERQTWKRLYGFDYFSQKKDADLVVDSSYLTKNQTVNKILDFIKGEQAFNS